MLAKKILIFLPIFYFLLLLQQSFLPNLAIRGQVPNLLLISVFLIAFFSQKREEAISGAFLAGLLLDIFSSFPLGFFAFLFVLLVLFFQLFSRLFEKSDLLAPITFIGFFLFYKILLMVFVFFLGLLGQEAPPVYFAPVSLLVELGYNLLALAIFLALKRCFTPLKS